MYREICERRAKLKMPLWHQVSRFSELSSEHEALKELEVIPATLYQDDGAWEAREVVSVYYTARSLIVNAIMCGPQGQIIEMRDLPLCALKRGYFYDYEDNAAFGVSDDELGLDMH